MATAAGSSELTCPHRRWGKTELSIPVIPFGTQGFGNHFGHVVDEDAVALVRRAVDIGVNHFIVKHLPFNGEVESVRLFGREVIPALRA